MSDLTMVNDFLNKQRGVPCDAEKVFIRVYVDDHKPLQKC